MSPTENSKVNITNPNPLPPEPLASKTNNIEIFIDPNGEVTFTDLPTELKAIADLLTGPVVEKDV